MSKSTNKPETRAFLILNGADIYPLVKDVTNLGRMEDNDIVLTSSHVSRYHAQIRKFGGDHLIVDLKSTSGTSVNGQPAGERMLVPGDVISLAGVPIIYGRTSNAQKLTDGPEPNPESVSGRKDALGPTDAVDVGSIDRFLDLFDPPEED
jgi:pSer/pThr/pTyr-binding forkhead associated (FHA) protein